LFKPQHTTGLIERANYLGLYVPEIALLCGVGELV
jgi:hypothetical protein